MTTAASQSAGIVHQIAISDEDPPTITGYVADAMASVKDTFGETDHHLWTRSSGAAFIAEHAGPEVAWAYRTLRPYSFKADLLKFVLLRHIGGWYVDIGTRLLQPVSPLVDDDTRFVVFRSTGPWDAAWNCSLALVYAAPGSPVFDTAIRLVVDHCRRRAYGHNPLAVSMTPFGRALAHHDVQAGVKIGAVIDVEGREFKRGHSIRPLGLVAARKPPVAQAGEMASIGLAGGNNYKQLWEDREVFGDEPPPRRRWSWPGRRPTQRS